MNQRELEKAIETELESWPDATVSFTAGGAHPKAKVMFGGKMLNVPYPGTPGDSFRGVHNTLSDIRRALKKLGAVRAKPEPSKEEDEAPYRKPNEGRAKRPDPVKGEKAEPQPDLADQLESAGLEAVAAADDLYDAGAELIDRANAARVSAKIDAKAKELTDIVAASKGETIIVDAMERGRQAHAIIAGELDPSEPGLDGDAIRAAFQARVEGIVDGIYFGLPDDVYHAVRRLSSSGLQKMCVSPANFWRGSWLDPNRPDPEEEETIWRILGRAYHTARLEPHLFDALYVRELEKSEMPKGTLFTGDEMGKALEEMGLKKSGSVAEKAERLADSGFPMEKLWHCAKARWEEERRGRTPLPAKYFDQMHTDMELIQRNSQIAPLLTGGEAEVSVFWTDEYGIKMKCRIDYLNRDWWADFKTYDNSRGKVLRQALSDAMRYNRYYVQAVTYRDGVEAIRLGNLPIIEAQTDDQRALIAYLQMKPGELRCWYIFQEKGGVPNLLAREFPFYMVPYTTLFNEAVTDDMGRRAAARDATSQRTQLHMRGQTEALEAKKQFVLHSEVYKPGEPWSPIDAIGTFDDADFHPYWLAGDMA